MVSIFNRAVLMKTNKVNTNAMPNVCTHLGLPPLYAWATRLEVKGCASSLFTVTIVCINYLQSREAEVEVELWEMKVESVDYLWEWAVALGAVAGWTRESGGVGC